MNPRTRKILLIEDAGEDELALREIVEDLPSVDPRAGQIALVPCGDLALATELARQESFDAILLNLSLPDSPTLLGSFLTVRAAAPAAPILALLDEPDDRLASTLLREGAQDVLEKSSLDAVSLARAINFSADRQKRANAISVAPFADELTGLANGAAFRLLAAHDLHIARQTGVTLTLLLIEAGHITGDLECLEFSDRLRRRFPAALTVSRLSDKRFALTHFGDLSGANPGAAVCRPAEDQTLDDLFAAAERALAAKPAMLAD